MQAPVIKFIKEPEVRRLTGLSHSSLYRGDFPKPVKTGTRASAWVESEVLAWMHERMARRAAA